MTVNDAAGAYHYDLPTEGIRDFIALVRPADDLDSHLEEINTALRDEGSGWCLESEEGNESRLLIPVRVSYTQPAGERPHPTPSDLATHLDSLPDPLPIITDPIFAGFPGVKPHFKPHLSPVSSPHYHTLSLTRGDFGRVPVAVLAEEPPPRQMRVKPPAMGRRPVVALLDTKVEPHDWLGEADSQLGGDGFWVDASSLGWIPGPRLRAGQAGSPAKPGACPPASEDRPQEPDDRRELAEDEGHGTFSAGLVRQVAPDAQVLAVHVIPDDGRVYGDHVLNALAWLADESKLDHGDVVCLPIGFWPVLPRDATYLDLLAAVLAELAGRGIRVVAAAGNDGSNVPVYPAAFAASKGVPDDVRLVSVGAYNTDGKTPAYFSNHGTWVTRWEIGTSVVSTFPEVNRAAAPELVAERGPEDPDEFPGRTTADPDDFTRRKAVDFTTGNPAGPGHPAWELNELTGGFARWSGTSFAAAIHAGKLAQERVRRAYRAGGAPPALS